MNLNVECDICVKCLDILDCILYTVHALNLLQSLSLCIRLIFFPPKLDRIYQVHGRHTQICFILVS